MCCVVLLYTAVAALAGRLFGVLRQELHAYARVRAFKLLTDMFAKVITDRQIVCLQSIHCPLLEINLYINLVDFVGFRYQ